MAITFDYNINKITVNGTDATVESSSFVKTGGTSNQFLKADGSVDSTVYLTEAPIDGNAYARIDGTWSTVISSEVNDLTTSVTWADVPDVNITQSSITQHQAALTITESQISDLQSYYLTSNPANYIPDAPIDGNAYARIDGAWSTVLSSEVNDLTTSVTWADVPDVNITQSSVTQHQSALSITESQISDLQSYYLTSNPANYISEAPSDGVSYFRRDASWVNDISSPLKLDNITAVAGQATYSLTSSGVAYEPANETSLIVSVNGVTQAPVSSFTVSGSTITFIPALTFEDVVDYVVDLGRRVEINDYTVTQTDVTQHQEALSITESQITNLQDYLLNVAVSDFQPTAIQLSTEPFVSSDTSIMTSAAIDAKFYDSSNPLSFVPDAPADNVAYVRENNVWIPVPTSTETLDSVTSRGALTTNTIKVGSTVIDSSAEGFGDSTLTITSNTGGTYGIIYFSETPNTQIGKIEYDHANDTIQLSAGGASLNNSLVVSSTSVTAPSIIKQGGLSTEFLKADGSVDSTSYLTGSGTSSQFLKGDGSFDSGVYKPLLYSADPVTDYKIEIWCGPTTPGSGYDYTFANLEDTVDWLNENANTVGIGYNPNLGSYSPARIRVTLEESVTFGPAITLRLAHITNQVEFEFQQGTTNPGNYTKIQADFQIFDCSHIRFSGRAVFLGQLEVKACSTLYLLTQELEVDDLRITDKSKVYNKQGNLRANVIFADYSYLYSTYRDVFIGEETDQLPASTGTRTLSLDNNSYASISDLRFYGTASNYQMQLSCARGSTIDIYNGLEFNDNDSTPTNGYLMQAIWASKIYFHRPAANIVITNTLISPNTLFQNGYDNTDTPNLLLNSSSGSGFFTQETETTLLAEGYRTVGGLSTEFLKADGSVDSNTYLTALTDTLQSVTNRGNITTNDITVNTLNSSAANVGTLTSTGITDSTTSTQLTLTNSNIRVSNQLFITPDVSVTPLGALHVFLEGTTYENPTFQKANDASGGIALGQKRSRGTLASPTALQQDDVVGGFTGQGYDGTNFIFSGAIRYKVDGPVSTNVVPMRIAFETSETVNPVERLVVKADGNVGIGTTDPTLGSGSGLVIYSSDVPRLQLKNSNTGDSTQDGCGLALSGIDLYLENREATGDIISYINFDEKMRVTSGGGVGIGTSTIDSGIKLQVAGDIKHAGKVASGAAVYLGGTTNWVKIFERHYLTASSFGYGGQDLTVVTSGQTDGHGSTAKFHITTKQQGTADEFSVIWSSQAGQAGLEAAYYYDSTGGDDSAGILTLWVRPTSTFNNITVHSNVAGALDKNNTGLVFATDTGSSTQPTSSTLLTPAIRIDESLTTFGGNLTLDGANTFTGTNIFDTDTNTVPVNISRLGSSSRQTLQIGVTDGEAIFNYIEDTTTEGTGNYGNYKFQVSGDEGTSPTVDVLTLNAGTSIFYSDVTLSGGKLRLTRENDLSLSSTAHAFQIGPDGGANLAIDGNEIMARNNGAASTLYLNNEGGTVSIGGQLQISNTNGLRHERYQTSANTFTVTAAAPTRYVRLGLVPPGNVRLRITWTGNSGYNNFVADFSTQFKAAAGSNGEDATAQVQTVYADSGNSEIRHLYFEYVNAQAAYVWALIVNPAGSDQTYYTHIEGNFTDTTTLTWGSPTVNAANFNASAPTANPAAFYKNGKVLIGSDDSFNTTPANDPLTVSNSTALGSTLYDTQPLQTWTGANGNVGFLELFQFRHTAGSTWTQASTRLQHKIDSTYQGYIQFNGPGNNYGVSLGYGTGTPADIEDAVDGLILDISGNIEIPVGDLTVSSGTVTTTDWIENGRYILTRTDGTGDTGTAEHIFADQSNSQFRLSWNGQSASFNPSAFFMVSDALPINQQILFEHNPRASGTEYEIISRGGTSPYLYLQGGTNTGHGELLLSDGGFEIRNLSASTETDALMISSANVVSKRTLGTNAFTGDTGTLNASDAVLSGTANANRITLETDTALASGGASSIYFTNSGTLMAYLFAGGTEEDVVLSNFSGTGDTVLEAGGYLPVVATGTGQMGAFGLSTEAAPALVFRFNELDTGLYRVTTDTIGVSNRGTKTASFSVNSTEIFNELIGAARPICELSLASDQSLASVTNGATYPVNWTTQVRRDQYFSHDTVTNPNRITVLANGRYHIRAYLSFANATTTSNRMTLHAYARVNGATTYQIGTIFGYTRGDIYGNGTAGYDWELDLSQSDYVEIIVRCDDADATYTGTILSAYSGLQIRRVE